MTLPSDWVHVSRATCNGPASASDFYKAKRSRLGRHLPKVCAMENLQELCDGISRLAFRVPELFHSAPGCVGRIAVGIFS